MIRTVIEVQGADDWEHSRQLNATLEKLGFEPKKSEDQVRWYHDFWAAFNEAGLDAALMIESYRKKVSVDHSVAE